MNKKILWPVMAVLGIMIITGCTAKDETVVVNSVDRQPSFERPEAEPDVTGLVKSIIGNEVTILKIERPEGAGQGMPTEDGDGESPPLSIGTTGTRVPGSRMGGGSGTRDADVVDMMKASSTGEEKVLIPVGIRMLKRGEEQSSGQVEAALTDVKKDAMITIWLDKTVADRQIAEFVLIN